jgi:hypothetical protein
VVRLVRAAAPAPELRAQIPLAVVLSQDFTDHFSVHIGQPTVDAVVTECELFMIDAEQMQDRGMQVVGGTFNCFDLSTGPNDQ